MCQLEFATSDLETLHHKLYERPNLNPNSIGVKYSLIVLGGGGGYLHHVSVLTSLLVKKYFWKIGIETIVIVMTKAVSNREICLIKAVLLLCEHGHFFSL